MAKKEPSKLPKLPFSVGDRAAFIRKATVALELVQVPTYRVLTYNLAYDRVEVIDIPQSRVVVDDPNTREQYYVDGGHVSGGPSAMAKTHLSWLRSQALKGGATPEAIRLLHKATGAFTKREENEMAEKLKAKKTTKSADTEGLKGAAKAAPVAKKDAKGNTGGKRGNPEALAKARAARSAGPDTRKITALKKPKDIAARAGSFRHQMLTDLLSSKTVQDFRDKDKKYDAGCIRFAQEAGYISLPAK